ncbi:MAG: hypothetical protein QNK37_18180 [Acidobacteriota bacterium]|nr:hypothetical protein [Acidobacteriota bacterium]
MTITITKFIIEARLRLRVSASTGKGRRKSMMPRKDHNDEHSG